MAQIIVGTLRVDLVANTATFTPGLDEAVNKSRQSGRRIKEEFDKVDFAEARGALALLSEDIGIRLPRHVRNFVAELPVVSKLLESAFAATAVVSLGIALFEAHEKYKKMMEAAEEAKRKVDDLNVSLANQATHLAAATMRLEDQIRALRGEPEQNRLAIALIEATERSDALEKGLKRDIEASKQLFEQQSHGAIMSFFQGKESSSDMAETLRGSLEKVDEVLAQNRERVADWQEKNREVLEHGTAAQKEAAAKELDIIKAKNLAALREQVSGQDGALAKAKGFLDKMNETREASITRTVQGPLGPIPEDASRIKAQEDAIDEAQRGKRTMLSQFTTEMKNLVTVEEKDLEYWKKSRELAEATEHAVITLTDKRSKIAEMTAKQQRENDKKDAERAREQEELARGQEVLAEMQQRAAAITREHAKEYDRLGTETRKVKDAEFEYAQQLAVSRGELTEHQAAEQALARYQKEKAAAVKDAAREMESAQAEIQRLNKETMYGMAGTQADRDALNAATDRFLYYSKRKLEIEKEYNGKIAAEERKLGLTFKEELAKWINDSKNMEKVRMKLRDQFFRSMDEMSGMLAKTLVEGQADWKQFAASVIESILSIMIQAVIAATIMKALEKILPKSKKTDQVQEIQEANFRIGMSDAAVAATNTLAQASATMFLPAAATLAGVAYGIGAAFAALAFFEKGGIIPNTGVAFVHKGEGVFPAPVTQALMRVATDHFAVQPQDRRSAQVTYAPQFSLWDKSGVATALDKHRDVLRGIVRREMTRS